MIYMTDGGKLWSALIFTFQSASVAICLAIALVVLLQLYRDKKSRAFAWLAASVALYNITACISDLVGFFDPERNLAVVVLPCTALGIGGVASSYFFMEYAQRWTTARHWIVALEAVCVALIVLAGLTGMLASRVAYLPDGSYQLDLLPIGYILLGAVTLITLYNIGLLTESVIRRKQPLLDRQFRVGLILMLVAGIFYTIPLALRLSLGSVTILAALLVMLHPVFGERLFDPLTKMNRTLMEQTAQLRVALHENEQLVEKIQRASIAKQEFISYLSHEIRTPISNILGTLSFMQDYPKQVYGVSLPEQYRSDVRRMTENGAHVRAILDEVLDLSKIEAGKLEIRVAPVSPVAVLNEVKEAVRPLLKSSVKLCTAYPDQLPDVLADQLRLRQILMNLLQNAAKFTDEGAITVEAQPTDGVMRFAVIDTGIGISPAEQARLFQAFGQASGEIATTYGGTGLGLSISSQLVKLQGGEIGLSSQEGSGSTFYFTLPLLDTTSS